MPQSHHKSHHKLYRLAEIYDIAFDFKDFASECEFMISVYENIIGRKPESWLEMAAGPARHTLEMARLGLQVTALDLSPEMVEYGRSLAHSAGVKFEYMCGDMAGFVLKQPVELAGLLLDSASYLLENETVYRHLNCAADALVKNGVYILEMAHPADHLTGRKSTRTDWESARDGKKVRIIWGDESDKLDVISQTTETSVHMIVTENGQSSEIVDTCPQRFFTCTEFQALVDASGRFEIVARYGAMDRQIDLRNEKAWRMISVLKKR